MKKIHEILLNQSSEEDAPTKELLTLTPSIRNQGCLTKEQAIRVLKWKSPRPLKHYNANTDEDFRYFTESAFKTKDDRLKIHILTALKGVSLPAASALLMVWNPENYPVIDIRAWQQLHQGGLVNENVEGQNFTLKQYQNYLDIVRTLANELNITARQVDVRLYEYDKKERNGNLYK